MQRRGGKNAGGLRRTCAVKRQTAFGKRQNGAAARLPAASAWEGGRLADMPAGKKAARPQATSRGGREAPQGYAKAKRTAEPSALPAEVCYDVAGRRGSGGRAFRFRR